MKSFNDHIDNKREELKEADPLDDLSNLLTVAAVGGGLWAMKKSWDKWGKGSVVANALAITKKQKAKVAQDKIDKAAGKQKDKETRAQADTVGLDKDEDGNLLKQKDAQAYKDKTGKAPSGWKTSPKSSPGKGEVWTTDDQTAWDAEEKDREAATQQKVKDTKDKLLKKKDDREKEKLDKAKSSGKFGQAGTSAKSKRKADRKAAAKKELEKRAVSYTHLTLPTNREV